MSRAPFVSDPDFTLYVGDVREVLAGLPDGSVDCVVTSPPYFGLRDYGTGQWAGGNADCDHIGGSLGRNDAGRDFTGGGGNREGSGNPGRQQFRDTCGKCGASRVDRQIGLEATPELFVQAMVEVFREVRRVLAAHGTCWVNLGDSYASDAAKGGSGTYNGRNGRGENYARGGLGGLKPKDLAGVPWSVAKALQAPYYTGRIKDERAAAALAVRRGGGVTALVAVLFALTVIVVIRQSRR